MQSSLNNQNFCFQVTFSTLQEEMDYCSKTLVSEKLKFLRRKQMFVCTQKERHPQRNSVSAMITFLACGNFQVHDYSGLKHTP